MWDQNNNIYNTEMDTYELVAVLVFYLRITERTKNSVVYPCGYHQMLNAFK